MEILKVLPKNLLSQVVGSVVSIEKPERLARKARDWFIDRYRINIDEAELPLDQYPSISKLFTRKMSSNVLLNKHMLLKSISIKVSLLLNQLN